MDGQVVILNLNSLKITVGDTLIIKKQGDYFNAVIESLQIEGENVQNCNDGEVGVKLNRNIKNNSGILVRKV